MQLLFLSWSNKKSIFSNIKITWIIIVSLIIILFPEAVLAQKTDWLKAAERQQNYPPSEYLIGFSSGKNYDESSEADLQQTHLQYAKQQLVESIFVTVNSSVMNQVDIGAGKRETKFTNTVKTNSQLQLNGLKTETFYDNRKNTAYAFVYAKKSDLLSLYTSQLLTQIKKIETSYRAAVEYLEKNQQTEALQSLLSSFNHFREIDDIQTVLLTISDLDFNSLRSDEVNELKKNIEISVSGIEKSEKENLNDLVSFLTFSLKQQFSDKGKAVLLNYFTYEGTGLGSPFSKTFYQYFHSRLINDAGFNIIDPTVVAEDKFQDGFVIKGNYYEEGNYLRVVATMRDINTGLV